MVGLEILGGQRTKRWSFFEALAAACSHGGRHLIDWAYGRFDCAKCGLPLTIRRERVEVFA